MTWKVVCVVCLPASPGSLAESFWFLHTNKFITMHRFHQVQVSKRSSSMHTSSNSSKGVLKPRMLNPSTTSTTSMYPAIGSTSANLVDTNNNNNNNNNNAVAARGKRTFNSSETVSAHHSASLNLKKSSSLPAKFACLCAPTKHVGSFRCRLHRATPHHHHRLDLGNSSNSTASSSSALLPASENSLVISRPKGHHHHPVATNNGAMMVRSAGSARQSRLRMVVVAAPSEDMMVATCDDSASSPALSEGSVKYIKVGAAPANVAALEAGALALRIVKNGS